MYTRFTIIFLVGMFLKPLSAWAQDPFFSQFYNAPLTLNPALTGISYGNIRVTANYRNHLSSFDPFETYAFSLDMSLMENKLNNDFLGFGLIAINDVSGLGLNNLKAMGSLAYHKAIGSSGKHYISLAAQGGLDQTEINMGELSTQSQWVVDQGLDRSLNNGEPVPGDKAILLDFQAGILWYSFLSKNSLFFIGSSVYHIAEPGKSVLSGRSKLDRRYVFHVGGKIGINQKLSAIPNFVFMQQNHSNVINSGILLEYNMSQKDKNQILSAGAWLRNTDAIIANVGLEYMAFQLGVSYDLILSDLRTITSKGGFEISLTYNFNKKITGVAKLTTNPNIRL